EWMLWILLPLVALMTLTGSVILLIYGPAFGQGGAWLGILGIACATNAFVSLGETVIMVQRPHLNLLNSSVTCGVAFAANLGISQRFAANATPQVTEEFRRFKCGRCTMITVSPNDTNAFVAHAMPRIASQAPPCLNAGP